MPIFPLTLHKPLRSVSRLPSLSRRDAAAENLVTNQDFGAPGEPQTSSASFDDQALADSNHKVQELLESIWLEISEFNTRARSDIVEVRRAAVEIAMLVASKFLWEETAAGRFPFEIVIKQLIDRFEVADQVKIFICSEDWQALKNNQRQEFENHGIKLAVDVNLHCGECRADDGKQAWLASLGLQLAEMRQALLEQINGDENAD